MEKTEEQKAIMEKMAKAGAQAAEELKEISKANLEAVQLVAGWMDRNYGTAGYTNLCRELRKYV